MWVSTAQGMGSLLNATGAQFETIEMPRGASCAGIASVGLTLALAGHV
jgi:hypothetical protein